MRVTVPSCPTNTAFKPPFLGSDVAWLFSGGSQRPSSALTKTGNNGLYVVVGRKLTQLCWAQISSQCLLPTPLAGCIQGSGMCLVSVAGTLGGLLQMSYVPAPIHAVWKGNPLQVEVSSRTPVFHGLSGKVEYTKVSSGSASFGE